MEAGGTTHGGRGARSPAAVRGLPQGVVCAGTAAGQPRACAADVHEGAPRGRRKGKRISLGEGGERISSAQRLRREAPPRERAGGIRIPRHLTGKTLREKDAGVHEGGTRDHTASSASGKMTRWGVSSRWRKSSGSARRTAEPYIKIPRSLTRRRLRARGAGFEGVCGSCLGHVVDSGSAAPSTRLLCDAVSEARGVVVARARANL